MRGFPRLSQTASENHSLWGSDLWKAKITMFKWEMGGRMPLGRSSQPCDYWSALCYPASQRLCAHHIIFLDFSLISLCCSWPLRTFQSFFNTPKCNFLLNFQVLTSTISSFSMKTPGFSFQKTRVSWRASRKRISLTLQIYDIDSVALTETPCRSLWTLGQIAVQALIQGQWNTNCPFLQTRRLSRCPRVTRAFLYFDCNPDNSHHHSTKCALYYQAGDQFSFDPEFFTFFGGVDAMLKAETLSVLSVLHTESNPMQMSCVGPSSIVSGIKTQRARLVCFCLKS